MRILQVAPYFAPAYSYGGPPETVHKLCEALANRGHEVVVLTTDAFNSTERQEVRHRANGLDVYYLRNLSNYLAWKHQLFLPLGIGTFLRRRTEPFDIIHVHSFRTYQNLAVRRYSLRSRVPYVLSAHGSVPRIVRKKLAKSVFDRIAGNQVLRDAAALIAVSSAELRQYEAMGVPAARVAVIPNGIDAGQYAALPDKGAFSRRYGLAGRTLIGYIGRLNSRKGLDILLESMRKLVEIRDDVTLVLVGPDDGFRGQVERLTKQLSLQDRVVLTGLITLPQKLEVLVDCDVFVYPGAFEIFGLVPFEALLCGKPVVVANDSGCGEIIERAKAGYTVPYGDSVRLTEAIESALAGGPETTDMIRRGRNFILEHLNWERIASATEDLYASARNVRS